MAAHLNPRRSQQASVDQLDEASLESDASAWWRLLAIASLAHVFGLSITTWGGQGVATLLVGATAVALLVLPEERRLRALLPIVVVISIWFEAPILGNHWLLAGFVAVAALMGRPWSDGWLERTAPGLRWILLAFYTFAAFAKLNSGFFDPDGSCARFFANQMLDFYRLPLVPADGVLARLAIFGVAGIELSIPILLSIKRTRRFGVLLAIAFHLSLALDLRQHFYDFTMMLVPLFLLFTPPGVLSAFDRRLGGVRSWRSAGWTTTLAAMVIGFSLPVPSALKGLAILTAWVLWAVVLVAVVRAAVAAVLRSTSSPAIAPMSLRPSMAGAVVVAVTLLNGLSPYLELKTSTSFNMYSNLVTGGGDTNHFVVPATLGLRPATGDLVVITETDDEDLADYVDSGFALPAQNLADYLAQHPQTSVTYEQDGRVRSIGPDDAAPDMRRRLPLLQRKFALLRTVPQGDTIACQNQWLPAR